MEYNKKLIDAVNALQGDLKNDPTWVGDETHYGTGLAGGEIMTLRITQKSSSKGVHGTIEEFNRCVEEMKNSDGVVALGQYSAFKQPLTKENSDYSFYGGIASNEFKWGDDVVFADESHSEHEFKFVGIDTHKEDVCFISSVGGHMRVKIDRLIHKPEPSDEDVKIKAMFDKYKDYNIDEIQLLNTITDMVNNGDL